MRLASPHTHPPHPRPVQPPAAPVALAAVRRPRHLRVPPLSVSASLAGLGGEHIPHVECVSQTLLHVNQWDPEGEADILIFGRPSYQTDVSKMIMNLAYYHRQLRAPSTGRGDGEGRPKQTSGSLGGVVMLVAVAGQRSHLNPPGRGFPFCTAVQMDPVLSDSGPPTPHAVWVTPFVQSMKI